MYEPFYVSELMDTVLAWGNSLLVPLLMLLAAIAAVVKLGGSFARVMTFIGFLLLSLVTLFWGLLRLDAIEPYFLTPLWVEVLNFTMWGGWLLVVIGLFSASKRRSGGAELHDGFVDYSDTPLPAHGVPDDFAADYGPGAPTPGAYGSPAPPPTYAAAPHAGRMPLEKPGWGLATWWIVFSAIAWVTGGILLAMYLDAMPRVSSRELDEMAPFLVTWLLALVPAVILFYVWLYNAWTAVPAPYRSATPGQAVGFSFIPFFNLYWVFRAIPGLSASIRRAMQANAPQQASGAGYGLGITACVIALIPYVGILSWIFFLIWVCIANSEKNKMLLTLAARQRAAAAATEAPAES